MKFQISKELDEILKKLDNNTKEIVFKKIDKILKNPELGKPLKYTLSGLRSERVGKYRLVYEIKKDTIVFHDFEHRKKVYK